MSAHIRYAYLKGHTWLFRRNYPVDVALALGAQALKQSLKTSDRNTARVRAAEVNARFETLVEQVRSQAEDALSVPESTADVPDWVDQPESSLVRLRATLEDSGCNLERSSFARPTAPVTRCYRRVRWRLHP